MLRSVMMTEKTRVTTSLHATSGSLGRSTVRAHPATRTGWWIPVTAFVAWLGFSVARASAHRWWGGTSRAARAIGDSR